MRAFVGAINTFLKSDNVFTSVSAFSPICNPVECDWGKKVSQPAVLLSACIAHRASVDQRRKRMQNARSTRMVCSLNRTHPVI